MDTAKLVRLRKLALEIVELTRDLNLEQPAKPAPADEEPTAEDYIALRARRRRRARG